jgi:putative redox protein
MAEPESVAIATIGTELYKTELTVGGHTLYGDEPFEVGGKNLGPRPGDFLSISLASCTAITLRMYANRKNFDVHQIQVSVSSKSSSGQTVFNTSVEIKGTLTQDQRARMLQIAKLCPVHKTLTNPISIETTLLVGE